MTGPYGTRVGSKNAQFLRMGISDDSLTGAIAEYDV